MESRFFLTDLDYRVEGDEVVTRLYGKTREGGKITVLDRKTKPYFYVLPEGDIENLLSQLREVKVRGKGFLSIEKVERDYQGKRENFAKVLVRNPSEVPIFRETTSPLSSVKQTLEKDIVYVRRYMIDKGLTPFGEVVVKGEPKEGLMEAEEVLAGEGSLSEPNLMALDIEVYNPKGEPRPEKDPIIAVSICSKKTRKVLTWKNCSLDFAECLKDEAEVLKRLVELIKADDPDIITGYYSDKFDFPYIISRARKLNVRLDIGPTGEELRMMRKGQDLKPTCFGRNFLDLFHYVSNIVSKNLPLSTRKLDDVAKALLGEGKEALDYQGIISSWEKNNIETLAKYSMKDSDLTYALGLKLLPNVYELARLIRLPLYDVLHMTSGQVVEWYLISSAYPKGIVVPNRPKFNEISERRRSTYEGAFVKEPSRGIHENIAVCDFRSLYPSIIVSHNIDPFTLNKGGDEFFTSPTGQKFSREGRGFVPETLEKLLKLRFRMKERLKSLKKGTPEHTLLHARQNGLKLIANSTYGYLGYSGARWYSIECAEAITSWARMYIKQTMEKAEAAGYRVLYGDSITPERFITVLNPQGIIEIKNIESLFEENSKKIHYKRGKGAVKLTGYRALTADPETKKPCWRPIREVIRHRIKKPVFRVNQKYGETCVTKDHSLIAETEGKYECVRPLDIADRHIARIKTVPKVKTLKKIDMYSLMKDYAHKSIYKGREKNSRVGADKNYVWFGWTDRKKRVLLRRTLPVSSKAFNSLLRLLALYIGEGSSSTPETTSSRWGASIALSERKVLNKLTDDYETLFRNARACVIRSNKGERTLEYDGKTITYMDNTHKLQMMNRLAAVMFKQLAGQKSTGKRIPSFIFHLPRKKKELFLEWLLKGDGSRWFDGRYKPEYKKRNFKYTTKSLQLAGGITLLLRQLGINFSINYRPSKKAYTISTSTKPNARLSTKIVRTRSPRYVYDLNVDRTHMFVDSCGQILLHNTDSLFISSKPDGFEEKVNSFVKKINSQLPDSMELELQGIYPRGVFITKKRYALISIKGDLLVKGLERVRKDWAPVAKSTQEKVLKAILEKNDPSLAKKVVEEAISKLRARELPNSAVIVYTQLTKDPKDYKLVSPHVAAAKRGKDYRAGMQVGFIIVPGASKTISGKARLAEEVGEGEYDAEYYIEHHLLPAVTRILESLGVGDFDGGKPQTNLNKFW